MPRKAAFFMCSTVANLVSSGWGGVNARSRIEFPRCKRGAGLQAEAVFHLIPCKQAI